MSEAPKRARWGWILAATLAAAWIAVRLLGSDELPVEPSASAPSSQEDAGSSEPDAAAPPMPPPFEQRKIVLPAAGEPAPSPSAAFCDESNWQHVDLLVGRTEDGRFRVDEDAWERALLSARAGLASWMSQCHAGGGAIEIIAATSGSPLATYDPQSGLHLP